MPDPLSSASLAPLARRDARVHDPSTIVRCGKYWYVFATGPGIASWRSSDLAHWERGPAVFPAGGPDPRPLWWTDIVPKFDGTCWAPDVIRVGNQYMLYYSVSAWGKHTSAIGLATSPTLDPADSAYHWTDAGIVLQTGEANDYNAIDPGVCRDTRMGEMWLVLGSFWSGIKAVALHPKTGLCLSPSASPPIPLAWNQTIEAACLYQKGKWWYLFFNWGLCCRGVGSTYEIRVGRSDRATGPFRDRDGKDLIKGGGSLFLSSDGTDTGKGSEGAFIGPGHAGIMTDKGSDFLSCHFYDGERRGVPTLGILPLTWSADGWPEVKRLTVSTSPF